MMEKRRTATRPLEAAVLLDLLARGKSVRRRLVPKGRLNLDRALPFLCVYREPVGGVAPGAMELATGIASYLTSVGDLALHRDLSHFVSEIGRRLAGDFGSFLLIEIWQRVPSADASEVKRGPIRVFLPSEGSLDVVGEELESALTQLRLPTIGSLTVETRSAQRIAPPGYRPLIPLSLKSGNNHVYCLGIEIPPVYYEPKSKTLYPNIHRELRRGLSVAINRAVYRFTRTQTTHRPAHYHAMGRRSLTKAVWKVDAGLAAVSDQFDFLLLTTPRNIEQAWASFQSSRFERAPRFSYRPLPLDIGRAKRELYAVPIERIEDPTAAVLFHEVQDELDRKLTMLGDRGTLRFVLGSQQVFGGVERKLYRHALEVLRNISSRSREAGSRRIVAARSLATMAKKEIQLLSKQYPEIKAQVQIRKDISGLMVSRGSLLIGSEIRVPASRVEPLLQHEVGTHILTYVNGRAQPFRQLSVGLPAYEELQEGLAVLAEYLLGGLSRPRLRLLAARVIAVRQMLEGAKFVDVFRTLVKDWGFSKRPAYLATVRVFRGGGHTKDAVYLRGLLRLLEHLRAGNEIEPLYIGKISLHHLPFIAELRRRKVLVKAPLRPRFLDNTEVRQRLNRLRGEITFDELVSPIRKTYGRFIR